MYRLTESELRSSIINASKREIADLALPLDFADTDWERLDYFGRRDRKTPRRAVVVVEFDDRPVGVMLRQAEASPRSRAQCSWCQDVNLTNEVVFYAAKRAGEAGRKGDTIGTLVCAEFGCSANVRKLPPVAYVGFDAEAARVARIDGLRERSRSFVRSVLNG